LTDSAVFTNRAGGAKAFVNSAIRIEGVTVKLMIVESPNKTKKLESILGDGWKVVASVGHVRDLPLNEMGFASPEFLPQYVLTERGEKVVKTLRQLVKTADSVYLATDPDSEGEAISWHLKEVLNLKRYERVTFNAISETVVREGLSKARLIDDDKVASQEGRRVADRMIGYTVSPALSLKTGISNLSAGRVQSPAVRLVVENERAIQLFKPTNHFGAQAQFEGWVANWDTKPYLIDENEYILDEELANEAAACRKFTVVEAEGKGAKRAPPSPFRTSTLQQAGSVQLRFNPDQTMRLAQNLFAAGHISYHRTDSQNFEDKTISLIREFAASKGWPLPEKPRKWKSVEGAQEAHEAIRPMHLEVEEAGDTEDEKKLYRLIWQRAIASQLADAEYKVNTLQLTASHADKTFAFKASGRVLVKPGWKSLMEKDGATEEDEDAKADADGRVPLLEKGSVVVAESAKVLALKTKAPKRYSQASLIAKLEALGIGRPSTYASILKNIMERAYIVEESGRLKATPLGMNLVVSLIKSGFSFVQYSFTSDLEKKLDRIANGAAAYREVVSEVHSVLTKEVEGMQVEIETAHPCPECGKPLRRVKGANGFFWGCSGFREGCKVSMDDVKGKPVPRDESVHPCPACGKALRRVKGANGFFWGCSGFNETGCKVSMDDVKGKPVPRKTAELSEYKCVDCSKPLIHRVKKGAYDFWACSGFPKCKKSYEDKGGKPLLK
jgi:DNA topoisomerase-1